MPRNTRNPKEYINQDPMKRSQEKLDQIITWLIQFHYSTRKIILEMLGLNINSHHVYFKKLEEKKIIKKTEAYTIRSDIYLLTPIGKELAAEKINSIFIDYSTESTKINHSNLRHNLAVQKMIIKLMKENNYCRFYSEKYIPSAMNCTFEKNPDALLEKDQEKTMLEVELTAKSERRIFKAFTDHCKGILNQSYQKVIYTFPNVTLKNYYQIRFEQEIWPDYRKNEKGIWLKNNKNTEINLTQSLRDSFEFNIEENIIKNL